MKNGEIEIRYKIPGGCDIEAEDCITKVLKMLGYQQYASGMDQETGVRELCFETKGGKRGDMTILCV